MVGRLNRFLVGWSNYFARGYSRKAFRNINVYVQLRMWRHLRRRSQRSLKPPEGMNWFAFIYQLLGVIQLLAFDPPCMLCSEHMWHRRSGTPPPA